MEIVVVLVPVISGVMAYVHLRSSDGREEIVPYGKFEQGDELAVGLEKEGDEQNEVYRYQAGRTFSDS